MQMQEDLAENEGELFAETRGWPFEVAPSLTEGLRGRLGPLFERDAA